MSVIDNYSCRGKDARSIWAEITIRGPATIERLCERIGRSSRYVHGIVRDLQSEGRVSVSNEKKVSDKTVEVSREWKE